MEVVQRNMHLRIPDNVVHLGVNSNFNTRKQCVSRVVGEEIIPRVLVIVVRICVRIRIGVRPSVAILSKNAILHKGRIRIGFVTIQITRVHRDSLTCVRLKNVNIRVATRG
jgi:hypothetical protein